MSDKITEFTLNLRYSNATIEITDGELSRVSYWGMREDARHDLEKHPNWSHAEDILEEVCEYQRDVFINIAKLLNKESQGYAIIKKIAQKKLVICDEKISKIVEEADFWKSFS